MKTVFNIRTALMLFLVFAFLSCACRYPNTGTASDRTGTNGATNGNGKTPRGNSHHLNY